jgi:hypothetical protein
MHLIAWLGALLGRPGIPVVKPQLGTLERWARAKGRVAEVDVA